MESRTRFRQNPPAFTREKADFTRTESLDNATQGASCPVVIDADQQLQWHKRAQFHSSTAANSYATVSIVLLFIEPGEGISPMHQKLLEPQGTSRTLDP